MAFWKKTPPPREVAMKTIVYRGGVVTFRIPSCWREEYSDVDGGTFYEDCSDSGTLRLKLILMTAPGPVQPGSGMDVLQAPIAQLTSGGVKFETKLRNDGNAVLKYEDTAIEDGVPLRIFYWVVANPLPPRHVRVANFSYTIPSRLRNRPFVQRELEMLEAEIDAVNFSSQVGSPGTTSS
ncbi:MAG TPA: hypothetical protein VGJ21_13075 [Terracidiphilus sp.]|jgi:hypothetical protein